MSTQSTTFEDVVHRIYQDQRATPQARELLLAIAYAVRVAPRAPEESPLKVAGRVLGRDALGRPRLDALVAADAPRYEPPEDTREWSPANAPGCQAPRLRPYKPRPRPRPADTGAVPLRPEPPTVVYVPHGYVPREDFRNREGICGSPSRHRVLEKDPRTGHVRAHWFCQRHREHADRVQAQVAEQNRFAPEPIPNRGGLLPAHFDADWEKVYRHYARPAWTVPAYGICADDWPDPATATAPARARLRLIV